MIPKSRNVGKQVDENVVKSFQFPIFLVLLLFHRTLWCEFEDGFSDLQKPPILKTSQKNLG
jgi:hypothetical protein